jgi:formylmethanofuran dehydrogenase subunit E
LNIGPYTFEEFVERATAFHGYPAPGLIIGGYMVEAAKTQIPEETLYEALVETPKCLPDAVQLLTPCSIGNGRLKIINWGLYALSLYDKFNGEGVRVHLDLDRIEKWPEIRAWHLKSKPKNEQDANRLIQEIRRAGAAVCTVRPIRVTERLLGKRDMGEIGLCPICEEAYPSRDGGVCRRCQGGGPYFEDDSEERRFESPSLNSVPVEEAVGKSALHDMTQIVPGESKGPALVAGQRISVGDICRLQQMGRNRIYVHELNKPGDQWVHENDAVADFAQAMAGEGVTYSLPPSEGKINFVTARNGLFVLKKDMLERFNLLPNVMCASRQNYTVVEEKRALAGCRALPLYLSRGDYERAIAVLEEAPLFRVIPMREAQVGILVTGTEVFQGLIEDKFIPIIRSKVEALRCRVVKTDIVPDNPHAISKAVAELLKAGADLIITTAGLSVDPDDVTLKGLLDAGAKDLLYGAPILPGAMTLIGRIGQARLMGVPACALYYKTTSFDLLFPRLLAGLEITRLEMAEMAEGGLCLNCKSCTFPKCPFGK